MKKLLLLFILLIVGCAHKPPEATFYIGMLESEFISKNKNIPSKKSSFSKDNTESALDAVNCIVCNTKYLYTTNMNQGFMRYYYWFQNDTLISVHKGVINYVLQKEIDYDKYPIPPELIESETPDVKTPKIKMNILDGEINSGSITLKTEDIIKDCKKECVIFTISSDEWCDCMNQCSQKVIDKISFGDMNVKVYIEECP